MSKQVKMQDIYDDIVYNELIEASCVLEQIKAAAISAGYYLNNAEQPVKKDSAAGVASDVLDTIKALSEIASNKLNDIDQKLVGYTAQDKRKES